MFHVYERTQREGKIELVMTNETFSLAGRNTGLLHQIWLRRGKPINNGWDASADEILKVRSKEAQNGTTHCLIIDFDPWSKKRVALIELLHVYVFTWGDETTGKVWWNPLMIKLNDSLSKDPATAQETQGLKGRYEPIQANEHILEFLYLNGDRQGWIWGKAGRTNAAFLHKKARDYFRKYFD